MTDRACIQVCGAGQSGPILRIVSDRDCRIWCSQMIYIAGCHPVNPSTGAGVLNLDKMVVALRTLDLVAGVPADLELAHAIILEGPYRNTVESPANGAMLLSGGDAWPGYEPEWWTRLRQLAEAYDAQASPHGPN
jgi:hypothetical protein